MDGGHGRGSRAVSGRLAPGGTCGLSCGGSRQRRETGLRRRTKSLFPWRIGHCVGSLVISALGVSPFGLPLLCVFPPNLVTVAP